MNAYYTPSLTDTSVPMPQEGQLYIVASSLEEANEKFEAYLEEKGYYEAQDDSETEFITERALRELMDEEVENLDMEKAKII